MWQYVIGIVAFIRMVASSAYIVSRAPKRHRSTIFGVYLTIVEASSILSPVVGLLIDRWGYYSTFTVASAVLVVVTITSSLLLLRNRE